MGDSLATLHETIWKRKRQKRRALGYSGNSVTQILVVKSGLSITSFGEDLSGTLYILSGKGASTS